MTTVVGGIDWSEWKGTTNSTTVQDDDDDVSIFTGNDEENYTCTDGSDDGELSFGEKVSCFFSGAVNKVKEQVSGLVETVKEHPVKTAAITAGIMGAAVAATTIFGSVAVIGMGIIGVGTAVCNGVKALKNVAESYSEAKNATTDAEAKAAYSNMGGSTTEVVENVGLGILSATQINSGLSSLKSTESALTVVAENTDDVARLTGETVAENADDVARLTGETVAENSDDVLRLTGETVAENADDAARLTGETVAENADDAAKAAAESIDDAAKATETKINEYIDEITNATDEATLKNIYLKAAKLAHPDAAAKNGLTTEAATKLFQKVGNAYETAKKALEASEKAAGWTTGWTTGWAAAA